MEKIRIKEQTMAQDFINNKYIMGVTCQNILAKGYGDSGILKHAYDSIEAAGACTENDVDDELEFKFGELSCDLDVGNEDDSVSSNPALKPYTPKRLSPISHVDVN